MNTYTLKQAWLSITRAPLMSFSIVATMAVVMATLFTVATLIYVALYKPLPYPEQDKLVKIEQIQLNHAGKVDNRAWTYPVMMQVYRESADIGSVALNFYDEVVISSLPNQPKLMVSYVSPEWFTLLDIPMVLGQKMSTSENDLTLSNQLPEAFISEALWQREFAGSPDVIGQYITLYSDSFQIKGVISKDFIEPLLHRDKPREVWLPFAFNPHKTRESAWGSISPPLAMLAKIAEPQNVNSSLGDTLTLRMNQLWKDNLSDTPFFNDWWIKSTLTPLNDVLLGDNTQNLLILCLAVLGLAVIATVNIANFMQVKQQQNNHTIAVHIAVGAKQSDITLQHSLYLGLLMLTAGLCAVALSSGLLALCQRYFSGFILRASELEMTPYSMLLSSVLLVLMTVFMRFYGGSSVNLKLIHRALKQSGKGTNVQISSSKQQIVIAIQVGVAVVIICGASMVLAKAYQALTQKSGFALEGRYSLALTHAGVLRPSEEQRAQHMVDFQHALMLIPGMVEVSQARSPFAHYWGWPIHDQVTDQRFSLFINTASETSFNLIDRPLLEGRFFDNQDRQLQTNNMIIDKNLAQYLAPNGSAVGMRITPGEPAFTVIGVVANSVIPQVDNDRFTIYQPSALSTTDFLFKADRPIKKSEVIAVLKRLNNDYVIDDFYHFSDKYFQLQQTERLLLVSALFVGLFTLMIATLGIYGVFRVSTQMRQHEIGTRMAVGAKPIDIIQCVFGQRLKAILLGLGAGWLVSLLVFATDFNLVSFFISSLLVMTVSAVAQYLPLRRFIMRPAIESLRGEV